MAGMPAGDRAEHVRGQLCRTKMCSLFQRRRVCRDDCSFAHSEDALRAKPDLQKTALCAAWQSGECCTDVRCRHAHGISELRGTAAVYKTQMCRWHTGGGKCHRGATCRHAHGESELRHAAPAKACTGKPVYAI